MKNKAITLLFALMLCMGVFLTPVTAFAADTTDTIPPILTATLTGDTLHIEAVDADSGVEAVLIDGERINYRVDSALDLAFSDYATDGEYVTIYAMDFAVNKSKEVQIKNPYFLPPTAPTEAKPFTPAGTGTVVDNATDGDGKEFFTITTPNDNVFYLIIDRQRSGENVYLLNAVTEDDLKALAKKSDGKSESAIPNPEPETKPTPTPEPTPEPQPEPAKDNTAGTIIFVLLAAAVVGGAGYYFKIYRPKKQQAENGDDDFDDEDEDDIDDTVADDLESEYLDDTAFDDTGDDDGTEKDSE